MENRWDHPTLFVGLSDRAKFSAVFVSSSHDAVAAGRTIRVSV
jgi:hypothetical protein